jgi:hypothetical protein
MLLQGSPACKGLEIRAICLVDSPFSAGARTAKAGSRRGESLALRFDAGGRYIAGDLSPSAITAVDITKRVHYPRDGNVTTQMGGENESGKNDVHLGDAAGRSSDGCDSRSGDANRRRREGRTPRRHAYAASEAHNAYVRRLMEEHKKAKAEGDAEKVKKLEAEGQAQQDRLHAQGFCAAPVDNILDQIKDQLPAIAREAGVDLIVSKWAITYRAKDAASVDVTERIIKPFHPSERTKRIVQDLQKQAPIPLEELKKHKD